MLLDCEYACNSVVSSDITTLYGHPPVSEVRGMVYLRKSKHKNHRDMLYSGSQNNGSRHRHLYNGNIGNFILVLYHWAASWVLSAGDENRPCITVLYQRSAHWLVVTRHDRQPCVAFCRLNPALSFCWVMSLMNARTNAHMNTSVPCMFMGTPSSSSLSDRSASMRSSKLLPCGPSVIGKMFTLYVHSCTVMPAKFVYTPM